MTLAAVIASANVSLASPRCEERVSQFLDEITTVGGPAVQTYRDKIDTTEMVTVEDAQPLIIATMAELEKTILFAALNAKTPEEVDAVDGVAFMGLDALSDIAASHAAECAALADAVKAKLEEASVKFSSLAYDTKSTALEKIQAAKAETSVLIEETIEQRDYDRCIASGKKPKQCK
tara:strand:- start:34 stop:564 length:531 start_codon:yes stop_codon:yes gene_type:complete